MVAEKQIPPKAGFVKTRQSGSYWLVVHVPHEVVVTAPATPQCAPDESTHQKADVVEATSVGRDTLTAYASGAAAHLVEPPPELTRAAAIAFAIVVSPKTDASPAAGHAATANVPYELL